MGQIIKLDVSNTANKLMVASSILDSKVRSVRTARYWSALQIHGSESTKVELDVKVLRRFTSPS